MPVPRVVVIVVACFLGVAPEHAGPEPMAEARPFLVVHDHEVELHLLDPGHAEGGPVDVLGQLIGARPSRHGQRDLDEHPAPAGSHGPEQAQVADRETELGVLDRVQRSFQL
jgi:hypothetical protein